MMVTLCGKKHTLNCTKYRFYHLMKGADRHGCLTPHSEDHCDEDYGNRLAHLILRIMMMMIMMMMMMMMTMIMLRMGLLALLLLD